MDLAGALSEALDRCWRPAAWRCARTARGSRPSKIFATNCASKAMYCCCIFGRRRATWCAACCASRKTEAGRLALEVARFSRTRPDRLEFVAAPTGRAPGRILREQFCARFRDLLARQFPDDSLASLTAAADLKHSLSGNYARGILRADSRAWAVLGAAPGESAATYDGLLTFGLLWLDRARQLARGKSIAGLRLFCPEGAGRVTAYRLQALSKSNAVELYEYNVESWRARRLDPSDSGNLDAWLAPGARSTRFSRRRARRSNESAVWRPPRLTAAVIPNTRDVALRYRGLLFALWRSDGMFYGFGDPRRALTPDRQGEFEALASRAGSTPLACGHATPSTRCIARSRNAGWSRWWPPIPTRVDARLDPRFFYAQVPALTVGDRGVMDAVAVTRNGRLAVIELKASEDLQLVLQAVDYWLRVRWHHAQQDFARYGYFSGHRAGPASAAAVSGRARAALSSGERRSSCNIWSRKLRFSAWESAEHWRRGVKVVLRQGRT